jgi:hypothetical protein
MDVTPEALVQTSSEDERARLIEQLVADIVSRVVDPILRRVVSPPSRDVHEEIRAEVLLRLMTRLRAIDEGKADRVESLPDYAAVVTYRTHADHLRRSFPERARLKDRLRHVLGRDARFHTEVVNNRTIVRLVSSAATGAGIGAHVAEILAAHGGEMDSDDLLNALDVALPGTDGPAAESEAWSHSPIHVRIEHVQIVTRLWKEISRLPVRQRIALLLNLRDVDGDAVVFLFPVTGVATVRQIAEVVEMSAEAFAALWNDLPLEDAAIAQLLGASRQQVINLRKSARERLVRRMTGFR